MAAKPKNKGGKKKIGRPSLFDKVDKGKLKALYLDGKTDAEIAEIFGITRRTVVNWRKKNPDFVLALNDEWKKVADHRVERSLYERACGYSHPETKAQWVSDEKGGRWEYAELIKHYPPSDVACIFWLKNRMPEQWRDKVEQGGESIESLADTLAKMAERLPG
jgi:hypothetical protein